MAVEKLEIETYFGKCKCCLNYGYLRTMWDKHIVDDVPEIYGQMLTQCFSIEWTVQNREEDDQICEDCIWKLREAFRFKKQVLDCQNTLKCVQVDEDIEIKLEMDNENYTVEYLDEEYLDYDNNQENSYEDSIDERESEEEKHPEDEDSSVYKDDDDIDENHHPQDEDDEDYIDSSAPRKRKAPHKSDDNSDTDSPKPKWPKKLPKGERWKTYKQYTEGALIDAVEAVVARSMNQKDAAKRFKVPRKTLSAKVLAVKNATLSLPPPISVSSQRVKELKTLLSYINATPFRSWNNQCCCFYCKERVVFTDADALRQHTRAEHSNLAQIELAMRPVYNNETVKLDVAEPACTVCGLALRDWTHIVSHLQRVHDTDLRDNKSMMPFILEANECTLCNKYFSAFVNLDAHMNTHFKNYVCGDCGAPFASASRLQAHATTHRVGTYPCTFPSCNKVFSLEKYLKKHVSFTHDERLTVKCWYCTEKFKNENRRHAHVRETHKEHLKSITCELCGASFDWTRHFTRHMKRRHDTKYACMQCGKCFDTIESLKEHEVNHKGTQEPQRETESPDRLFKSCTKSTA